MKQELLNPFSGGYIVGEGAVYNLCIVAGVSIGF